MENIQNNTPCPKIQNPQNIDLNQFKGKEQQITKIQSLFRVVLSKNAANTAKKEKQPVRLTQGELGRIKIILAMKKRQKDKEYLQAQKERYAKELKDTVLILSGLALCNIAAYFELSRNIFNLKRRNPKVLPSNM